MKTVTEQLATYACYHRDRRNIATHLVGIPMIVFAIQVLLSRPELLAWQPLALTPALIVSAIAALYYLRLDFRLGLLMTLLLVFGLAGAAPIASSATATWLTAGIGLFVIGWGFQFVGHYFEGRKPAFVDDIIGLAIGPLFVVSEVVFMVGARPQLHQAVEAKVSELMQDMPPATKQPS